MLERLRIKQAVLSTVAVMGMTTLSQIAFAEAEKGFTAEMQRRADEYTAKNNRQNLTGWDGILFYCSVNGDSGEGLSDVCEKTRSNAAFLAAVAQVPMKKASSAFELGFSSLADDHLILEVRIHSTTGQAPTAIGARIMAYVAYRNAIEAGVSTMKNKRPRAISRSGDLIFWERSVIGASSGGAAPLHEGILQGIEKHLKDFFADYLNSQRQ